MNAAEYKVRWQGLMKAIAESHDEWWQVWEDTFSKQKHAWLVEYLNTLLASLDGDPVYMETEIGRSLGSHASLKTVTFGRQVVVVTKGEFGSKDPDAKHLEVRIFARSNIRSIVPTSIDTGSLDDDAFPARAEATVDYGQFGLLDLGNAYAQYASRGARERFAGFLPDLISDLGASK